MNIKHQNMWTLPTQKSKKLKEKLEEEEREKVVF